LTPTAASCGEKLDAHDIAVRYREHKGAARRIGLDQAADIDVALGDDTVERGDDPLISLLLLERLCCTDRPAGEVSPPHPLS
jgi:hypothetical protein